MGDMHRRIIVHDSQSFLVHCDIDEIGHLLCPCESDVDTPAAFWLFYFDSGGHERRAVVEVRLRSKANAA